MRGKTAFAAAALLLGLGACTGNTAPGNDREARLDPGLLKPEAMTDAEGLPRD